MEQPIWYVFRREDGVYMGSGTPYHSDSMYDCTLVACPEYDPDTEIPVWDSETETWALKPL